MGIRSASNYWCKAEIKTPLTVVGIVGDVKQFGLHTAPRPEIYVPSFRPSMTVIVRGTGDLSPVIRGLLASFLPAYRSTRVDPLIALRHE